MRLPPTPMTTAVLVNQFLLAPKIIATMDLAEAFSHKIAATLERNLARDLYDLTQFEPLTTFDKETLQSRLAELEIRGEKSRAVSLEEACRILQEKAKDLTEKKLKEELSATLPPEQLVGLETLIRACVSRVAQKMSVS